MTSSTLNTPKSDFLESMESIAGKLSEETRKKISDIFDIKIAWLQETAQSISNNSTDIVSSRFDMMNYIIDSFELFSEALQLMPEDTLSITERNKVYNNMVWWFMMDINKHPVLGTLEQSDKEKMIKTAANTYLRNSQKK
jgi:hypothetical protein